MGKYGSTVPLQSLHEVLFHQAMEAVTLQQAAGLKTTMDVPSATKPAKPPQQEPGPVPATPQPTMTRPTAVKPHSGTPVMSLIDTLLGEALSGQMLQEVFREIIKEAVRDSISRSGICAA